MPLTRIEVEEVGPGRWNGWVEGGGSSARRKQITGTNFDDTISAVIEAHTELYPPPAPAQAAEPVRAATLAAPLEEPRQRTPTASERAAAESAALGAEVDALPALNALREEAEALGIDVDGRWGEQRLREEIENAPHRPRSGGHDAA